MAVISNEEREVVTYDRNSTPEIRPVKIPPSDHFPPCDKAEDHGGGGDGIFRPELDDERREHGADVRQTQNV